MISETRTIMFSNDTLDNALRDFFQTMGSPWPNGYIQFTRMAPNGVPLVTKFDPTTSQTHELQVSAEELGVALVSYCIAHQIPLPQRGTKSIGVRGDNVALTIEMNVTNHVFASPLAMERPDA